MEVTCRAAFHPRHIHRCGGSEHTRRNLFALHHILKWSAKNRPPDAIRRYSHRCIGRARHKLKRARQLHRIYPASAFASSTLGERRLSTRGAMRCSRAVPYSTLQTLGRERQLRHIYPASAFALSTLGERRLSTRGAMRCCRGIPYSAFRIPHSEFLIPHSPSPSPQKKAGRLRPVFFA